MRGFWLADGATVVHFAPWVHGAPLPLCSTLGWQPLTERRWSPVLERMVYRDNQGRDVHSGLLQGSRPDLPLCLRCVRRHDWQATVVAEALRVRPRG